MGRQQPVRHTDTVASYDEPLDAERMSREQGAERAKICDKLETMFQGLQQDIEYQRLDSERGVDPRLQQLQIQVLKLHAQLWRMTAAPLPEPPPVLDPAAERHDAAAEAAAQLDEISERLADG
jgi:hypothetical protein